MNTRFLVLFIILTLPLSLTDCARNPVTGKKEVALMSQAQEQALGDESDPQIVAAYGLYEDSKIQQFINQKGRQMAQVSHRPELTYTFKVLDSPVVNAFALPGGYVYFTRGIMAHFNNEAEFAGVLGHEIGHITARHTVKQHTSQLLGNIGLLAGIIVSPTFRQFADQASQGLGLMFLKFGRDHESESDELGVEYSTKIGYDAHQMADFFQTLNRLQTKAGVSLPDFLSTHPNPGDRYNTVHALADQWQVKYPQSTKINRDLYLKMIDGMIYGDDPKQGFVEDGKFYHPVLKFEYPIPADWQLQNSPTMVQMAPQDGKALMQFSLSPEKTTGAAANKLIQDVGLQVVERQNSQINGFPAVVLLSDQTPEAQNGQAASTNRILSYFIEYGDMIYVFHGMAAKNDFNNYVSKFKSTMTQFKELTDQQKINKKPVRIKVVRVQQAGNLKDVLKDFGVSSVDLEELAIINGMELSDQLQTGMHLKVFNQELN